MLNRGIARSALLLSVSLTMAGQQAEYRLLGVARKPSVVESFSLSAGPPAEGRRWVSLAAAKQNGEKFSLWMLSTGEPARANVVRYLFQDSRMTRPREYRDARNGAAVLPAHGGWEQLQLPLLALPAELQYLGHRYRRGEVRPLQALAPPAEIETVELRPDLLVGPASNTRQKDETRRYDGSDYQLIPLSRQDYRTMKDAGITCVRVNDEQWPWADEMGLYFWGAVKQVPYPEILYRSNYIGAALYLDEPAVTTRDYVVRPKLRKDPAYRKSITPQVMVEEFGRHFAEVLEKRSPWALTNGLRARADVDLGEMNFPQQNLYTWETMVSTAAYQLSQNPAVPEAIVFEPPGRVGTRRTLPEIDMTYGVELPPDDPKALTSILFGFLRGAARATGKQWGVSIYGGVDRTDSPFWLTHAYDLGATRFFFWDNYQYACVPFGEVLDLARHLREHVRAHPRPALESLRGAAEAAVLLPPGYDLGHVQMGKGNLWGIHELNLERKNRAGVTYRAVMSRFFSEIERLFKAGKTFDLLWDLPGLKLEGYREVVRVREDTATEKRPRGEGPRLEVSLAARTDGTGVALDARARVEKRSAEVFYTYGADTDGVYRNALAAWEVYGPEEEDQMLLIPEKLKPRVALDAIGGAVEVSFMVSQPGAYRLRVSTVDIAGRSTVVWKPFTIVRGEDGKLGMR